MAIRNSTAPLTDFIFAKAEMVSLPLSGTFELTPLCNFNCRMCYVHQTPQQLKDNPRKHLSTEEWLSIAKDACEKGMLFALLTGGEPMLRPDFWTIYDFLVDAGVMVSINTNGSQLTPDAVKHFQRKPPRRINLTLYGACDETYQRLCGVNNMFPIIDRSICMLKDAGIQLKLNCSLTPYNVSDLEAMVLYAKEKQLILDIVTYMFPPLRRDNTMVGQNDRFTPEESAKYRMQAYKLQFGEERYQIFLKNILAGNITPMGLDESCVDPINGKIICKAGKSSFWITWDGKMLPCGMMTEPEVDLLSNDFHESWKKISNLSRAICLSGICYQCPDLKLCHSCAAMAYTETGTFQGIPKYLCNTIFEMKKIAHNEIR